MISNKIKIFIIILFSFVVIISIKFLFAWGYFHIRLGDDLNQSKYQIKIMDTKELANNWLKYEAPTQIYNINVQDYKNIEIFLKEYKYLDTNLQNNSPGYNSFKQTQLNNISLKEPPKGLLSVYIVPRENPFHIKYSNDQYSNTLSELLNNNKISMKEIYCFWNVKEKPREQNVQIHHIIQTITSGETEEKYINDYLNAKNIVRNNNIIKKGCYNMTQTTGLIIPLPNGDYNNNKITNIYFDDGLRIIDTNKGNIEDLLNMANGAKNIYIFSLSFKCRPPVLRQS